MQLPWILDLNAAQPLQQALLAARGRPLALDAAQVERMGGLCLQVLVAAESTWIADAQPFVIENRSAAFEEALRVFGLQDFAKAGGAA
ncbi:MAG: STAS domain-containing protein [Pseudomonadota bacterium]